MVEDRGFASSHQGVEAERTDKRCPCGLLLALEAVNETMAAYSLTLLDIDLIAGQRRAALAILLHECKWHVSPENSVSADECCLNLILCCPR